jgi:hypothetical protein
MIQSRFDPLADGAFQVGKVDDHPLLIQLATPQVNFDRSIVSV